MRRFISNSITAFFILFAIGANAAANQTVTLQLSGTISNLVSINLGRPMISLLELTLPAQIDFLIASNTEYSITMPKTGILRNPDGNRFKFKTSLSKGKLSIELDAVDSSKSSEDDLTHIKITISSM